jgi:hypothetical protein
LRYTYLKRDLPVGNPIANVLVIIAGAIIIAISLVLGFFAFLALGTLVLISAAVIGIRVWWLRRKLARRAAEPGSARRSKPTAGVIEGEFQVLREDDERP